jgi:signal transduction histidine kinase
MPVPMRSSENLSTRRIWRLSSNRSSLRSVVARVIAVSALGAAAIGATLALFFVANERLRSANTASQRSATVSASAFDLRGQVLAIDQALQAVIADYRPDTLAQWRHAARSWEQPAAALERAASASNERQARRAHTLREEIRSYIDDYGEPVVGIARVSPAAVRSSDRTTEGTLRLDQIITDTDAVARNSAVIAADRSAAAGRLADQATIAGIFALVLTPVLLILLGLWLARVVADPLRQTVKAASEVAAGNFDVRLNDRRRDEFGELAHVFNTMTESLAVSRSELIERADSLERSERHKSELISMVSHEVRTPLSSVLGFTRLLLERDLPEADRQRYLEIVDAEATRLATLVSDFLDARLIEEGRFSLRREPFDLRSLVREQAEVTLGHDENHELELELPDRPLRIDGDRARLAQVVGNVLSNAVKYSPEGGTITVGAAEASGHARVWVADEGTGIPLEHRSQLFQPFYRGDAAAAGIPGTGLGLAVSRRIVEAHDGRIGFDPLDRGTRFWFDLPLEPALSVQR